MPSLRQRRAKRTKNESRPDLLSNTSRTTTTITGTRAKEVDADERSGKNGEESYQEGDQFPENKNKVESIHDINGCSSNSSQKDESHYDDDYHDDRFNIPNNDEAEDDHFSGDVFDFNEIPRYPLNHR